jgi:hypothetical protein
MAALGIGSFAQGMAGGLEAAQARKDRGAMMERLLQANYEPDAGMPSQSNTYGPAGGPAPRSPNALTGPAGAPASATEGPSAGLFGLIDRHEGGGQYDTLFGFSQRGDGRFAGTDVSSMTIGQALEFASPRGEYGQWVRGQVGRVATPMGRHQIVGTTLRNAARDMGLPMDTPFSPQTQDAIANHLARQRLARADSMEGKVAGLRSEWEGFRNVDDATLIAAIRQFEAGA